MTEKIVTKYATPILDPQNNATETTEPANDYGYSPLEVAGLLSFLVGVFQVAKTLNYHKNSYQLNF